MKFIWKIENFSNLECDNLQSPPFSSHTTNWELIIEPNSDCISVQLKQLGNKDIPLNCSFSFLDNEGSPFVWKEAKIISFYNYYGPDYSYEGTNVTPPDAWADLIERNRIFGSRKSEILPNDILTLQCRMWKTVEELSRPLSIFARSRVEAAKIVKKFDCNIPKASLLCQEVYVLEHVEPIMDGEHLMSRMLFNEKNILTVESNVSMFRCKMEIKILLLDAVKMKKVEFSNGEYNFCTKEEVWKFNTQISKNMIMSHQNQYLPNNILTLHFICSFSNNVIFNHTVDEDEILNIPRPIANSNQTSEASVSADKPEINQPTEPHPPNTLSQALQDMFKEGFLSDFNLKVGDRVFPVHRSILGMRSQVFRAMFTSEMKEKTDNFVDIQDVEENTFHRMLQFVYSDKFDEKMGWERASSLYAAADRYALEPLKQGCSAILQSELSVSSVLEVLAMADMHQDQDLKSAALDFIAISDKEVFSSERWSEFEKENGKLALDTFHYLYFKKMNI